LPYRRERNGSLSRRRPTGLLSCSLSVMPTVCALLERLASSIIESGPGTLLRFIRFSIEMGKQAEKCRRRAVQCESTALHSPDEEIRLAYLELAHLWRQIAAQAETLDRSNPEPGVEQH
jgi:hypothetical protein